MSVVGKPYFFNYGLVDKLMCRMPSMYLEVYLFCLQFDHRKEPIYGSNVWGGYVAFFLLLLKMKSCFVFVIFTRLFLCLSLFLDVLLVLCF